MKPAGLIFFLLLLASCQSGNSRPGRPGYLFYDTILKKEVNGRVVNDTVFKKLSRFCLQNQDGVPLCSDFFRGKVTLVALTHVDCRWVTELTSLIGYLEKFHNREDFLMVNIGVDLSDSIRLLKLLRQRLFAGSAPRNVHFATFARRSERDSVLFYDFKAGIAPKELDSITEDINLTVHSNMAILFDKEGHTRRYYEYVKTEQFERLKKDIGYLLKE